MKLREYELFKEVLKEVHDFLNVKSQTLLNISKEDTPEGSAAKQLQEAANMMVEWIACLDEDRETDAEFKADMVNHLLQDKLNMANGTVAKLMEENHRLRVKLNAAN